MLDKGKPPLGAASNPCWLRVSAQIDCALNALTPHHTAVVSEADSTRDISTATAGSVDCHHPSTTVGLISLVPSVSAGDLDKVIRAR
jgi:hypothetical protein